MSHSSEPDGGEIDQGKQYQLFLSLKGKLMADYGIDPDRDFGQPSRGRQQHSHDGDDDNDDDGGEDEGCGHATCEHGHSEDVPVSFCLSSVENLTRFSLIPPSPLPAGPYLLLSLSLRNNQLTVP